MELSCYRVIVLSPLHRALPKQNLLEAFRLSCYRVIVLSLLHEGIPKHNHHFKATQTFAYFVVSSHVSQPPTWNYCVACFANNVDAMRDKNNELVFEH